MNHGGEIYQEGIADGLDDLTVMLGHHLPDELIMDLQQSQHAGFIGPHLAAKADDVGEHNRRQATVLSRCCPRWFPAHGGDYATGSGWLSNRQKAVRSLVARASKSNHRR